MLRAVASYFSSPTPSGDFAVKISPQRPQRSLPFSMTSASSGAPPFIRTSLAGFLSLERRPFLREHVEELGVDHGGESEDSRKNQFHRRMPSLDSVRRQHHQIRSLGCRPLKAFF